jgi:glucuronate isomerase
MLLASAKTLAASSTVRGQAPRLQIVSLFSFYLFPFAFAQRGPTTADSVYNRRAAGKKHARSQDWPMSLELRKRLFDQLDALVLIDPHTHINAHRPAAETLADILGYHYYTELAHSAGMPKDRIEEEGLDPKEKVGRLIANLGPIENTIQYSWLIEMCQVFFDFEEDRITSDNWEQLYDTAAEKMKYADWPQQVLAKSKLEAVFLTNDFDDPLENFNTSVYVPCLRTDDLVFHLADPEVRRRLYEATGIEVHDVDSLRLAISTLFVHFLNNGARACAISLPPDFAPTRITPGRAETAISKVCTDGRGAAESHLRAAANFLFWTLAEHCAEHRLPFDLMIGVNRGVYAAGVHQGRDLYDSRVSLIQYQELFNAFPQVTFPISVLASVTNQELTSYAWIFPNVVTNGHWWYSNTPTYIEHDAAARLEAVPRTKQVGYYSDMYKLEFALPKFAMYKRILAKILAERYVIDRGWSEERAVDFGTQVLRGNVETIFGYHDEPREPLPMPTAAISTALEEPPPEEPPPEESPLGEPALEELPPEESPVAVAPTVEEPEPPSGIPVEAESTEDVPVGEPIEEEPSPLAPLEGIAVEGESTEDVLEGVPVGEPVPEEPEPETVKASSDNEFGIDLGDAGGTPTSEVDTLPDIDVGEVQSASPAADDDEADVLLDIDEQADSDAPTKIGSIDIQVDEDDRRRRR